MFEGLNDIPWYDLKHTYGSAEEVPMWLRPLRSDDAKVRRRAMYSLGGSICHQGFVCPATAYTVPYLIELLDMPETRDKDQILDLLADIAMADPFNPKPWRDNPKFPSIVVPAHVPFKDTHGYACRGKHGHCALHHAA